MLAVIDNGSIFTPEITMVLLKNNTQNSVIPFQQITKKDLCKFDSFILSGRRKNEKKMNALNSEIIKHAVFEKKSLLGICYGAEILALTLGGTIRKRPNTVQGILTVNILKPNSLFEKDIQVYQSHNYEIAKLGSNLESLARSNTCQHEMIKHISLPIFGTQFHPEKSEEGQKMIEAFIDL